jgi:hypothetical protein
MLTQLKKEMQQLANPEKAKVLSGFFKTGPGQYGEGDIFLGITVPESRKLAIQRSPVPRNTNAPQFPHSRSTPCCTAAARPPLQKGKRER